MFYFYDTVMTSVTQVKFELLTPNELRAQTFWGH